LGLKKARRDFGSIGPNPGKMFTGCSVESVEDVS
jgi:hypothetical protein